MIGMLSDWLEVARAGRDRWWGICLDKNETDFLMERVALLEHHNQRLQEHNTELTLKLRELQVSPDGRLVQMIKQVIIDWEELSRKSAWPPRPTVLPRRIPAKR